jgi:hypothetical protein
VGRRSAEAMGPGLDNKGWELELEMVRSETLRVC